MNADPDELQQLRAECERLRASEKQAREAVLEAGRDPRWAVVYAWLHDPENEVVSKLADTCGNAEIERSLLQDRLAEAVFLLGALAYKAGNEDKVFERLQRFFDTGPVTKEPSLLRELEKLNDQHQSPHLHAALNLYKKGSAGFVAAVKTAVEELLRHGVHLTHELERALLFGSAPSQYSIRLPLRDVTTPELRVGDPLVEYVNDRRERVVRKAEPGETTTIKLKAFCADPNDPLGYMRVLIEPIAPSMGARADFTCTIPGCTGPQPCPHLHAAGAPKPTQLLDIGEVKNIEIPKTVPALETIERAVGVDWAIPDSESTVLTFKRVEVPADIAFRGFGGECPFQHENIDRLVGVAPTPVDQLPKTCTCGKPLTYASPLAFVEFDPRKEMLPFILKIQPVIGAPVYYTEDDQRNDRRITDRSHLTPGIRLFVPVLNRYVWAKVSSSSVCAETDTHFYPLQFDEQRGCWICVGTANKTALSKLDLK